MAGVKKDVRLKEFWRKNERFADLFNAALFSGKEVIKPEDLQEMDTDMSGIVSLKGVEQSLTRARDVVKKSAYGVDFVILGIENQQKVHYRIRRFPESVHEFFLHILILFFIRDSRNPIIKI